MSSGSTLVKRGNGFALANDPETETWPRTNPGPKDLPGDWHFRVGGAVTTEENHTSKTATARLLVLRRLAQERSTPQGS